MGLQLFEEPSPELEAQRYEEAKGCTSCLEWNRHCNSECCRSFSFSDRDYDLRKPFIMVRDIISVDLIWYYKLHGCTYNRGYLKVPTEFCVRKNGKIHVVRNCDYLTEDGKCKGHELGRKPKVCRALTLENVRKGNLANIEVTRSCLFRYKANQVEE